MKHLAQAAAIAVALAAAALAGCGGSSSTPTPTPTLAPTTTPTTTPTGTPTATPTTGPLMVAYTTTFGANVTATAAPPALAFQAQSQTATLTASQANYAGTFTALSNCAPVVVGTGTSTWTVTAADATRTTVCTVTVSGATGTTPVALSVTVPTPGGVVLRWYGANYSSFPSPVPAPPGPINIPGTGSLFAAVLAVGESSYVGGFPIANVVLSGCVPAGAVTYAAATPTGLPTAAPGNSLAYYTVTGAAGTTNTCVITATDLYVPLSPSTPNPSATIGITVTAGSGTGN